MAFAPIVGRALMTMIQGGFARYAAEHAAKGFTKGAPLSFFQVREMFGQRAEQAAGYSVSAFRGIYDKAKRSYEAAEKMNDKPGAPLPNSEVPIVPPPLPGQERQRYSIIIDRTTKEGRKYSYPAEVTSPRPLSAQEVEDRAREVMDERYPFDTRTQALINATEPGAYDKVKIIGVERAS